MKNLLKASKEAVCKNKCILLIFAFFVVFTFYYSAKLTNFVSNAKYADEYRDVCEKTVPLTKLDTVSFVLSPNNSAWRGITLFFDITDTPFSVGVTVKDKANGKTVFSQSVIPEEALPYYRFTFANAIKANGDYEITVNGSNIAVKFGENDTPMYKLYGNLLGKLLIPLTVCFWLMFAAVFAVMFYLLFVKQIKTETLFLIGAIIFGGAFMVIMPPLTVGDECRHYDSAYLISNSLLGISSPEGKISRRVTDLSLVPDDFMKNDNWTLFNYYEELWPHVISELKKGTDTTIVTANSYAETVMAYPLLYTFSALGLTVGRLLKLNFILTFLLGRFFNLAFFIAAVYVALKKCTIGKTFFASFALMPMVLHQIASFSYDSVLFTCVLWFVITVLSITSREKPVTVTDLILLCIAAFIITPAKTVYFPLIFVAFVLLSKKNFASAKNFYVFCATLATAMILGFVFERVQNVVSYTTNPELATVIPAAVADSVRAVPVNGMREMASLGWIVRHPFNYAYILLNTLVNRGSYYVATANARYLGWEAIPMNELLVYTFLAVLLYQLLRKNNESLLPMDAADCVSRKVLCLGTARRTVLICIAVFITGSVMTGLYIMGIDPIVPVISSIQGRYFLPIVPLLILCKKTVSEPAPKTAQSILLFQCGTLFLFIVDLLYRIVGIY